MKWVGFCLGGAILLSPNLWAKSVYVVDHIKSQLIVLDASNDTLTYQAHIPIPKYVWGPIDIVIDNESQVLFISNEGNPPDSGGNILELYSAKTLDHLKTIWLTGMNNTTGLEYDAQRHRLYCTNRNQGFVYAFDWDADALTLSTVTGYPIVLSDNLYATGLARKDHTLLVTEFIYRPGEPGTYYRTVQGYDLENGLAHTEDLGYEQDLTTIAYNRGEDVLYGCAWGQGHLIKQIFDPNTVITKQIGASAIAVETDDDKPGRVYLTSYRYGRAVELWDTRNWTSDPGQPIAPASVFTNAGMPPNSEMENLSGLAVGGPYKPPIFKVVKDDGIPGCVQPGNTITYTIAVRTTRPPAIRGIGRSTRQSCRGI